MDVFTMVVIIVAISVGAGILNNWIRARSRWMAKMPDHQEYGQLREDVSRLTDRINVLEKIVTDQERQLSEEIRRLG